MRWGARLRGECGARASARAVEHSAIAPRCRVLLSTLARHVERSVVNGPTEARHAPAVRIFVTFSPGSRIVNMRGHATVTTGRPPGGGDDIVSMRTSEAGGQEGSAARHGTAGAAVGSAEGCASQTYVSRRITDLQRRKSVGRPFISDTPNGANSVKIPLVNEPSQVKVLLFVLNNNKHVNLECIASAWHEGPANHHPAA